MSWLRRGIRHRPHDPERNAAEYVTGELSRAARRWFEAHLLHCDDCWGEVVVGRLGRRLAEEMREQAPAGLRDRVRASVHFASVGDGVGRSDRAG